MRIIPKENSSWKWFPAEESRPHSHMTAGEMLFCPVRKAQRFQAESITILRTYTPVNISRSRTVEQRTAPGLWQRNFRERMPRNGSWSRRKGQKIRTSSACHQAVLLACTCVQRAVCWHPRESWLCTAPGNPITR